MTQKIPLIVFDFDHTLLDVNSDVEIQKLLPGKFFRIHLIVKLHGKYNSYRRELPVQMCSCNIYKLVTNYDNRGKRQTEYF